MLITVVGMCVSVRARQTSQIAMSMWRARTERRRARVATRVALGAVRSPRAFTALGLIHCVGVMILKKVNRVCFFFL